MVVEKRDPYKPSLGCSLRSRRPYPQSLIGRPELRVPFLTVATTAIGCERGKTCTDMYRTDIQTVKILAKAVSFRTEIGDP